MSIYIDTLQVAERLKNAGLAGKIANAIANEFGESGKVFISENDALC